MPWAPGPHLGKVRLEAHQVSCAGAGWVRTCASLPRSVYLHNNKLADAGLPDNMFNGSSNVEILILSSNFLRHVPKHLPPALYKLHLKVGGRGQGGALPELGPTAGEEPRPTGGTGARLWGLGPGQRAQHPLRRSRQKPGRLALSPTPSTSVLGRLPMAPADPSPHLIPSLRPRPSAVPHAPLPTVPPSQNNKLEKIPPGVFSELSNLRELYLQNNYLTDEGLDNETFW